MDSVTYVCNCGERIGLYKKEVLKLRETGKSLRPYFDSMNLKICCRTELTSMITKADMLDVEYKKVSNTN